MKRPVEVLPIKISNQENKTDIKKNRGEPVEKLVTVLLDDDPEKIVQIGSL